MNLVKATADKVLELEKRLDNSLTQEYMKVQEFSRTFETTFLITSNQFLITSFNGSSVAKPYIVQGDVKIRVFKETNVRTKLFLDGYEVYNRVATYEVGAYNLNILKSISIGGGENQNLTFEISLSGGGEAEIQYFNFFIWGYGEGGASLTERSEDPKLEGIEFGGNYYLYLVLNDLVYLCKTATVSETLGGSDFKFLMEGRGVEPFIFKKTVLGEDGSESEEDSLFHFFLTKDGKLVEIEGEISEEAVLSAKEIKADVTSVSTVIDNSTGELVVVYSSGGKLFYFVKTSSVTSEEQEIISFNEDIKEVCLLPSKEPTTFLAVSLESGKNYLFSSATSVDGSPKESRLQLALKVNFE